MYIIGKSRGCLLCYNCRMRKQVIKIVQKQPTTKTHNTHNYHQLTYLTDKLQSSSLFENLSNREEIELGKLKNNIETASPRQKELLLLKVKAVQRVSTSHQKQKQQSIQKKLIQQQSSPKLKTTTDRFAHYHQNRKRKLEYLQQAESRKEQLQEKNYEQLLEMQIEILKEELDAIKKEKESLKNDNISLKFENDRLWAQQIQKDMHLNNLQSHNEELQKKANNITVELQNRIQNLAAENEVLRNEYYKMIDKLNHKMAICSQNVRLSIVANPNSKTDHKDRNAQLELINIEKKYSTIITQIKQQHEDEIQKLRKTMFDSINYYRDLNKKSTVDPIYVKYREFQNQLTTEQGKEPSFYNKDVNGLCISSEKKGGK